MEFKNKKAGTEAFWIAYKALHCIRRDSLEIELEIEASFVH